jgi:predicted Rossmann fold flavoprotein
MTVAVIGAGASGMTAALQAAWNGADVTLFERNEVVGRKLLVTGSGRCNITNDGVKAAAYTCADPAWMDTLLNRFGVDDLLRMLAEIGILAHKTPDGWYYPISESAATVVDAFSSALNLAGVTLVKAAQVSSMRTSGKGLSVRFSRDGKEAEKTFERVIVSAGGKAYPTLGSRGELFPVLEQLGHTVLPGRPALAPLLAELGNLQPLQGIRLDVGVTLWNGTQRLVTTRGNLIFTQWGLNGPAVMDISHHVSARPQASLEMSLNLLAYFQEEFDHLLAQKRTSYMPLRVFLGAFFPPKAAMTYLKNAHLAEDIPLCQVNDSTLGRLVEKLKDTRLTVKGVRDFEFCQISAGGVPVGEVDPQTLESRRVKGLFLTGETLDVVGPCGGYNLQYAFSSGALAGRAAAGKTA